MNNTIKNKEFEEKKTYHAIPASIIIVGGCALLLLITVYALTKGAASISVSMVLDACLRFDVNNPEHLIIRDLRLTREITSLLVGISLAVSGALMQGVTRNPLADSGLMGLNAGAGFMLAICFSFLPGVTFSQVILFSFIGAGFGACAVYGISGLGTGGNTPMKLVLSGAAVTALLVALSQGIALFAKVSQNITFWTMGSVAGIGWNQLKIASPIIILSLIASIILSRYVTLLSLGNEIALGLGVNIKVVKPLVTIIVILLAGSSVALAGSIGFVGMLIPHLARFLVGVNYKHIIPVSAVLGGILMVLADLGSRTINPPFEVPIGAITSLIGAPVFLYLARKQKGGI